MPKHVVPIKLNDNDAIRLAGLASGTIPAGEDVKRRAAAVLELSKGKQIKDVASELGMRENSVTDIRRRFLNKGMAGLENAAKSGRPLTKNLFFLYPVNERNQKRLRLFQQFL